MRDFKKLLDNMGLESHHAYLLTSLDLKDAELELAAKIRQAWLGCKARERFSIALRLLDKKEVADLERRSVIWLAAKLLENPGLLIRL